MQDQDDIILIHVTVNGTPHRLLVESRRTLLDMLHDDLGLTGTHTGCEHGNCGACTILFDGQTVRSCLMFAVQANCHEVMTVEGLAHGGQMHPLQQAFCTPGFLMTAYELLKKNPTPSDEEIRTALSGNICRCTGYQHIVDAVRAAAQTMASASVTAPSGTPA